MISRRFLLRVAALTVALALGIPGAANAAISRFLDVSDSNVFVNDIEWLADQGVTQGCNPPANDRYCPDDNVTRGQMAAFLHRLSTEGAVDAGTVDGFEPGDLIRVFSFYDDDLIELDDASLGSFSIEAPVDGYLILDSSIQVETTVTDANWNCAFRLDGTQVPGTMTVVDHYDPDASESFPSAGPCASHAVVPVTAGAHTITLMGHAGNFIDYKFSWATASALFTPFGADVS